MDERARSLFYLKKKKIQTGKQNRRKKKDRVPGRNSPRVSHFLRKAAPEWE